MKNIYDNSFKDTSFLYKNSNSICSNIANSKEDKSFFYNNKKKIEYIENYDENSILSKYKKINSLHKRKIIPKCSKYTHNNSSSFIEGYESKTNYKYNNLFIISQQDEKKPPNSLINTIKKHNKTKIIFNKKKKNNNISDSLRKESILKLSKMKNKLKLSSEYEKAKESISSNSKREFFMESNRNNKIKDNNKYLSKCNSSFLDTKNEINNFDINRYINEKESYTKRDKPLYSKIYNRNKNQKYENYRIKSKYNKNNIFKNSNNVLYKEGSIKLYPKNLSCKNINNKYSKKYSEQMLSNNKNKNNNSSAKDILSNKKVKNKTIIINNKINEKIENYINKKINNSKKKITVNLNNSKFNIKKKENYINTNLINNFHNYHFENENKKVNLNKSQTQFVFSPISSIFTKTHENSLSIFSIKNLNKKEIFTYREYPKLSIESSNKLKYNNNFQEMTQDSSELNNIIDLMKNQLGKYKCNTSYYLNGEKNFFCSPDGPEDFHFRFVELCKQNKSFFRKLNSNISNDNNSIIDNNLEYQENFENSEEEVPYI